MAQAYRSGQGTIIPTLFIGLGGTGSRIVDRIAGRAALLPNWDSQLRPLTAFVSIDTNELDQHKLKHIPKGNQLNIAGFDKQKVVDYFRRSEDPQALQWIDKGYQPRAGVKPGAGQIRVESRLGFFYNSPDIKQRLKEIVADALRPGITWRQAEPPKYYVYIFCTLAGGTGSGSFLSVAYLIDAIINQQQWQPRVIGNLLLSTLLTDKVGPELHPDIHANTYAALKEVEHMTKLDYKQVKDEGRTSEPFVYCRDDTQREIATVNSRPFFLSFIIDRPAHISLPDVQAAVGDAAFLQIFTPIIDNLAGELDNYEKKLEGLTRFPGDLKDVGLGYTQNFGAFGAAAMVLPAHDFLTYSALRFAAQAIRSQITFGVDSNSTEDDRTRALAKLAVNYSDPKFLRMSDEAREAAINQAFVMSVHELARQDEKEDILDGFWYQLMASVNTGIAKGVDKAGETIRNESLLQALDRKLTEARSRLLNKISIKERAFVFHREGLNQYIELVGRLMDEIRSAKQLVDNDIRGLENAASEGEVITELKLEPISERYLVIRLLDLISNEWIPAAQQQLEKAQARDINNAKVRERLERELYENLQQAAANRPFFNRDQPFLDARDEAQEYYRSIAAGTRKVIDAEVRLRQLRTLLDYLQRRSRQYARLSTRMNSLVQELENDAERYRRGEAAISQPFALRVEVLESMEEPRQRLWQDAYQALFTDEGRYLSTFDRKALAETITQQLKPTVRADGKQVDKSVEQTVTDLRRALVELGEHTMRGVIFGDAEQPGLTLINGIELEAKIVLRTQGRSEADLSQDDLNAYREKKFRALAQLSSVFAQINAAESKALDDGVIVNRTRQVIEGVSELSGGAAGEFMDKLQETLSVSGKQVKTDTWHDPRLIIVHDVELPIPLYYWQAVIGDVEAAYLRQAADERRSYHLHIDYNWEKSLPNLNPRQSELSAGWTLKAFIEGLVTKVFSYKKVAILHLQGGKKKMVQDAGGQPMWVWTLDEHYNGKPEVEILGENLSAALYRLGEFHRDDDIQKELEKHFAAAKTAMQQAAEGQGDSEDQRRSVLLQRFESLLSGVSRSERRGEISREEALDRPILRTLINELRKEGVTETGVLAEDDNRYAIFDD